MRLVAFLPCRKGSQRVPHKNTRQFAGWRGGLLEIKLTQLSRVSSIDGIVLSTNDNSVVDIAESLQVRNLTIDWRPEHLSCSSTPTDALIKYVPSAVNSDHILWTHVTSPFISSSDYSAAIQKYARLDPTYDSLMSVTPLRTFIWNKEGPLNYARDKIKWPNTQDLDPLYEINSGIFIASTSTYESLGDRIGKSPHFYPLDKVKSLDIDWEEDFELAEIIWTRFNGCTL